MKLITIILFILLCSFLIISCSRVICQSTDWEAEVIKKYALEQSGNFMLDIQIRENVEGLSWDIQFYVDTEVYQSTSDLIQAVKSKIKRFEEKKTLWNQISEGTIVKLNP